MFSITLNRFLILFVIHLPSFFSISAHASDDIFSTGYPIPENPPQEVSDNGLNPSEDASSCNPSTCAICFEELDYASILFPCLHTNFCCKCHLKMSTDSAQAFLSRRSRTPRPACPLCREKVWWGPTFILMKVVVSESVESDSDPSSAPISLEESPGQEEFPTGTSVQDWNPSPVPQKIGHTLPPSPVPEQIGRTMPAQTRSYSLPCRIRSSSDEDTKETSFGVQEEARIIAPTQASMINLGVSTRRLSPQILRAIFFDVLLDAAREIEKEIHVRSLSSEFLSPRSSMSSPSLSEDVFHEARRIAILFTTNRDVDPSLLEDLRLFELDDELFFPSADFRRALQEARLALGIQPLDYYTLLPSAEIAAALDNTHLVVRETSNVDTLPSNGGFSSGGQSGMTDESMSTSRCPWHACLEFTRMNPNPYNRRGCVLSAGDLKPILFSCVGILAITHFSEHSSLARAIGGVTSCSVLCLLPSGVDRCADYCYGPPRGDSKLKRRLFNLRFLPEEVKKILSRFHAVDFRVSEEKEIVDKKGLGFLEKNVQKIRRNVRSSLGVTGRKLALFFCCNAFTRQEFEEEDFFLSGELV